MTHFWINLRIQFIHSQNLICRQKIRTYTFPEWQSGGLGLIVHILQQSRIKIIWFDAIVGVPKIFVRTKTWFVSLYWFLVSFNFLPIYPLVVGTHQQDEITKSSLHRDKVWLCIFPNLKFRGMCGMEPKQLLVQIKGWALSHTILKCSTWPLTLHHGKHAQPAHGTPVSRLERASNFIHISNSPCKSWLNFQPAEFWRFNPFYWVFKKHCRKYPLTCQCSLALGLVSKAHEKEMSALPNRIITNLLLMMWKKNPKTGCYTAHNKSDSCALPRGKRR